MFWRGQQHLVDAMCGEMIYELIEQRGAVMTVFFPSVGEKTLRADFVRLAPLSGSRR